MMTSGSVPNERCWEKHQEAYEEKGVKGAWGR